MNYVGIDWAYERAAWCAMGEAGQIEAEGLIPADEDGLAKLVLVLGTEVKACVEMMSGAVWVRDRLEGSGWDVSVAHARKVRDVAPLACKTDKVDDQFEDAVEVGLRFHLAAQIGRRLEASHRPLQLSAAHLARLVRAGVVARDRSPLGEHHEELLVGLAELGSTLLVGEVEVAVDVAEDHHRAAEEGRHRRVLGG